jgi:outer membrane lipoprotein-sorting protein
MGVQNRRGSFVVSAAAMVLLLTGAPRTAPQTTPRQGAAARESFDELYERGQRVNAGMKTLTARFTETTTSSLLTRPLVSHGVAAVERPSRVLLRYTDEESRALLIDGNKMILSWPGQNIRRVTDIKSAQGRVQKYFVNGSASELRREFEIQDHDNSDRAGTYYVTMLPKRKQIREVLSRLDLWVDRSTFLLAAMRMTFANGDTKSMAFEDVVLNAPIGPETFSIDP